MSEPLAPGVRRLRAPNPGPMTFTGTNTYLVGETEIAVIDPGPDDAAHVDAILKATGGRISHIIVTHAHRDHTGCVPALRSATGAPVCAFGPAWAGRTPVMEQLAREGLAGGGEGVDDDFATDTTLTDGDRIVTGEYTLDVIHTPGHFAGHLSFRLGDMLFSGDHIMGWSTTLISPPDGDLTAFMASTRRLQNTGLTRLLPGHGDIIDTPDARLEELIAHRESREEQILAALKSTPQTVEEITHTIYTDIAKTLLPAAARNVFAHLIDLHTRGLATATPTLSATARFARR